MKSKQSIGILIALMSVALTGVILIQFLWIRNAIQLKQEQFDRTVNSALIRVSADLENKYGVHFITEKLQSDSSARKEVMKQDPGLYQFMISVDESKQKDGEDMVENNNESNMPVAESGECSVSSSSERTTGHMKSRGRAVAMVNIDNNQKQEVVVKKTSWIQRPTVPHPVPVLEDMPVGQTANKCKLINIVKDAADEWAMSKMSAKDISDVIDSTKIISSIKKEFAREGLPQDFVFATYCVDGDSLMINKASSHGLNDFTYKSPLLATDFIDAKSLLLLNFRKQYEYIFHSLWSMLTLSLFFTIAIISAFAYSLHVIFRQKKLSEITNDFINNMTHELKTPLATISMTADTLGLATVSNNAGMVGEYSGMIKNEVKKLSRHVDRILEAAVLEKNGNGTSTEIVNFNQLIEEEVKVFEPQIQQKGGKLNAFMPTDNIRICANRDLLRGAVCNLLDNAAKYSKEIPDIKVMVTHIGNNVLLCVEDQGIGISINDQKMIFEKFFRAPTGNRHDVKGFGLGLSFVKSVIENLHGRVWVESTPGKGSKFFVEIPITE